jgi:PIN domain nuclease of toxin-antitoxin system
MRTLEIGTWVQLTSESGRVEPAKVSWISPISSRLLFVNRRGIRVLVASAEELAAMARLGRLQLREADTAFDDAMHQVMGKLKAVAPAPVSPAEGAAAT